MFEVELKFRVADPALTLSRLAEQGVELGPPVEQVDRYFNHPSKDFAQTDEALRIRSTGEATRITYKGPKLDAATKTRREIELPLSDEIDALPEFTTLLEALGFRRVTEVAKLRRIGEWRFFSSFSSSQAAEIEVAWDDVREVGQFIELELAADAESLDAARHTILAAAAALDLSQPERRSYLEMLLTIRSRAAP